MTGEFLFEPTPAEIFRTLLPRNVETQIFRTLLESAAAEHAAAIIALPTSTVAVPEPIARSSGLSTPNTA